MHDDISGFVGPVSDYGAPDPSSWPLIHSSEEGFYELYRGERAGRFQAYKCLKPQWRGQPLQEAMLKKEFELGYPLRHPNIRETYQYTYIEGLGNCIEMEWVDGVPLSEYLKQGRPDERSFRKLASELCDALTYLHSRQTLHRDLKPSNIMVTHDGGNVKLIDFGLSDSSSSAILKAPAGTRRFMAPEVAAGGAADVRSDIWSLGAVLGEMTSRHKRVISKCTRVQPSRRFRSAAEVKEALLARPLWPWLVLTAAAIAAIAALWLHRPSEEPPVQPKAPVIDTVRVLIQTPPETGKPVQAKPRSKPSEKEKALDNIFEQASELFEDKL